MYGYSIFLLPCLLKICIYFELCPFIIVYASGAIICVPWTCSPFTFFSILKYCRQKILLPTFKYKLALDDLARSLGLVWSYSFACVQVLNIHGLQILCICHAQKSELRSTELINSVIFS